jgi:hypothetical protein
MAKCIAIVKWTDSNPVIEAALTYALREFWKRHSIEDMLKRLAYDGFDSYEDYEKYGDCFIYPDRRR